MILYSHTLYGLCERYLGLFERRVPRHGQSDAQLPAIQHYDVILFGLGRYGGAMYERLSEAGQKILAIDFDPDNVQAWQSRNIPAIYGDMADPDFLAYLPLYNTRWVIAATPIVSQALTHNDPRLMLIESLKHHGYTGCIAVAAQHAHDAERLQQKGADLILMPFVDAADQAADLVLGRQRRAAVPEIAAKEPESSSNDVAYEELYDDKSIRSD